MHIFVTDTVLKNDLLSTYDDGNLPSNSKRNFAILFLYKPS